jgi:hypothetical protein
MEHTDDINTFLINRLNIRIARYKVVHDAFRFVTVRHNRLVHDNNETVDAIHKVEAMEAIVCRPVPPPVQTTRLSCLSTDLSSLSFLANMKPLHAMPSASATRLATLKYQSRVLAQTRRYRSELGMVTRRLNNVKRARALVRAQASDSVRAFEIVNYRYMHSL